MNEYARWAQDAEERRRRQADSQRAQASANLRNGKMVSASSAAAGERAARALGYAPLAVDDPALVQEAQIQEAMNELSDHFKSIEWLSIDPNNAVVAQDHVKELTFMERWANTMREMTNTTDEDLLYPRYLAAGVIGDFLGRGLEGVGVGVERATARLGADANGDFGTVQHLTGLNALNATAGFVREVGVRNRRAGAYLRGEEGSERALSAGVPDLMPRVEKPEGVDGFLLDATAGIGQVGGAIATGPISLPMLYGSGVSQAHDNVVEAQKREDREGEYNASDDMALTLGGLVTGASERLGLRAITGRLPAAVQNRIQSRVGQMLTAGATEGATEIVENVGQNAISRYVLGNDTTLLDGEVLYEGGVGAFVGTAANALVQTAVPGRQHVASQQRADRSMRQHDHFAQAVDGARNSELRKQSPERFKDFLESIDVGGEVFVPADKVAEFFQSNPDLDQWMDEWDIRDQVEEALVTGSDVVIPRATYLAQIADTDAHTAWSEDIRFGLDEMSKREAATFAQTGEADTIAAIDAAIDRAVAEAPMIEAEQRVYDDVRRQLREAGYTADVAHANARHVAHTAAVRADRSPDAFPDAWAAYNDLGLSVRQEFPEAVRRRMDNLDTMLAELKSSRAAPSQARMFGRSMMEFLATRGGVFDSGGELAAMNIEAWHNPRKGGKAFRRRFTRDGDVREGAYEFDGATQAAIEEGYLPEGATQRDLLDVIREELAGRPRFSAAHEVDTAEIQNREGLDELERLLGDLNLTPDDDVDVIRAALEKAAQGPSDFPGDPNYDPNYNPAMYDQSGQIDTESEAFKAWFGDSKVVDENGNPLVVYHGTNARFDAFQVQRKAGVESEATDQPIFFSTTEGGAVELGGPNVMPVYLSVQKLFDPRSLIRADAKSTDWLRDQATPEGQELYDAIDRMDIWGEEYGVDEMFSAVASGQWDAIESKEFNGWLKSNGYDGFMVYEGGWNYAVFDPTQIKSVNNRGTFDPNDPNIYNQDQVAPYVSDPRVNVPNVRGGWSLGKIKKYLKGPAGSSAFSKREQARAISEFSSPEELASRLFYHGSSVGTSRGLRAGAALTNVENFGGGYGEIQHSISLSASRDVASNFTAQASSGVVYPVILRKGAKLVDRPDLSDAIEVEDVLVELWEQGVDAVRIGDHSAASSEQEIVVLNPAALVRMEGERFNVFQKKRFENMSAEEIASIYSEAVASRSRTYNQETPVDTRGGAFKAWFGDSKAVDKNGDPLVVYHGTNAHAYSDGGIEAFATRPLSGTGGAYFTSSEDIAGQYGERTYPVYLSLQNPLIVDAGGKSWRSLDGTEAVSGEATRTLIEKAKKDAAELDAIFAELEGGEARATKPKVMDGPISGLSLSDVGISAYDTEGVARSARALGFDGVIFRNVQDSPTADQGYEKVLSDVLVAFTPTQIKSVNNRGTFDPNDPNIYNQDQVDVGLSDIVTRAGSRGVKLSVSDPNRQGYSVLSMIDTRDAGQGQGVGSEIMADLVAWADRSGVTLALTPEAVGNTSKKRLTDFYKRFGFMENKGRNKDFNTREAMVRAPVETYSQSRDTGPRGQVALSDGRAVIRLFANRDLSTFTHEMGHVWLEQLRRDAMHPNASDQIKADMQLVLDWFASQDGAEMYGQVVRARDAAQVALSAAEKKGDARGIAAARAVADEHDAAVAWLDDQGGEGAMAGVGASLWEDAPSNVRGILVTPYHELWARGIERYMMEGKSPSVEMRDVFRNVMAWMKRVYRSVLDLKAPLSDEVRGVMDRLFATDAEIEQAREATGAIIGADALAEMGATDAEVSAYRANVERSRSEAEDDLLQQVMSSIRRMRTKEWNDAAEELRDDVTAEVDAMPDIAALKIIKDHGAMDRDAVVAILGYEAGLDLLPRGVPPIYSSKGGQHPDMVAEAVGYRSGSEMLYALMEFKNERDALKTADDKRSVRQKRIDDRVRDILQDRYGDVLNDGSIEQEAVDAIHSERYAELLAVDLRVLGRRTGNTPAPIDALRQWAKDKIGARRARDVRPGKYLRAERTASNAVQKALADGNRDEAFRQKQAQSINNVLYVEAGRAHREVEAILKRLRKLGSKVHLAIDVDYRNQIDALLDQYELRRVSGTVAARRQSLAEFVKAQEEAGQPINIPADVIAASQVQNVEDLTVDEVRALGQAVANLEHLGRMKRKLKVGKEKRDLDAVADEAWASAQALPDVKASEAPGSENWFERVQGYTAQFEASLVKAREYMRLLDDGNPLGIWSQTLDVPGIEAANKRAELQAEFWGPVKEAYEAIPSKRRKTWMDKVADHPFVNPNTGDKFGSLKHADLIGAALHTGTASNFEKMAKGYGLVPRDADPVYVEGQRQAFVAWLDQRLTAEEWDYVQSIWDAHDRLKPQYFAAAREIEGFDPEAVEGVPVVLSGRTLKGGYAPISYHSSYDQNAQRREQRETSDMFGGLMTSGPRPDNGSTNARNQNYVGAVRLGLEDARFQAEKHITYTAYAVYVNNSLKFLQHPIVSQTVKRKLGIDAYKTFEPWLANQVRDETVHDPQANAILKAARTLRVNMTASVLLGSATVLLSQPGGLAQSAAHLGPKWLAKGVAHATSMGGAVGNQMRDFITSRSDFMRLRLEDAELDRDYRQAMSSQGKSDHLAGARVIAGKATGWVDFYATSGPTWLGAYDKAMSEGRDESDAIYLADLAVRTTQGGGRPIDQAGIQSKNEMSKLVTFAYGWANAYYNMQRSAFVDFKNGKDRLENAIKMSSLMILPHLLDAALTGDWPEFLEKMLQGEWPEDWQTIALDTAEWFGRNVLFGAFAGVPVVRDAAGSIERSAAGEFAMPVGGTPWGRFAESVLTLGGDVWELATEPEKFEGDKFAKHLVTTLGLSFGVPGTSQINRTGGYLLDVADGDQNPDSITDWMTGLLRGSQKEQK